MVFVIISPFAFLILLFWVFSFLILVRFARGLSILFIFSRKLFVSLILCMFFVVVVSVSWISAPILVISLLLLVWGFVSSYFSRSLSCSI
jgi:hypothetical protein